MSTASSKGVELAESLAVVRTGDSLVPWGEADAPRAPDVSVPTRRLSFALSEHDVAALASLTGVHEPIHEDAAHAWRLGHSNVLVQELTLLLVMMQMAGAGETGSAEMWFRSAVPVGSMLTLWQGATAGSGDWEVRATGSGEVAAVGRLVAHRPDGRCGGGA